MSVESSPTGYLSIKMQSKQTVKIMLTTFFKSKRKNRIKTWKEVHHYSSNISYSFVLLLFPCSFLIVFTTEGTEALEHLIQWLKLIKTLSIHLNVLEWNLQTMQINQFYGFSLLAVILLPITIYNARYKINASCDKKKKF